MRLRIPILFCPLVAILLPASGQYKNANTRGRQVVRAVGQSLADASSPRALANADELRKESRLPEWANYVCYEDSKNMQKGLFMVIGYQPDSKDIWFQDAKRARQFGYSRSLTYQEYFAADNGVITALNMPMSSEEYTEEIQHSIESGRISIEEDQLTREQMGSEQNAIAIANSVRQATAKYGVDRDLLKDEEALALLDAPEGTNFHNYLVGHPGYLFVLLYRQKYYSAGLSGASDGIKPYREGSVLFESDFGSDVFETASISARTETTEKSTGGGLTARIQIQETPAGLRFLKSHSLGGAGLGIPTAGKCGLLPKK